MTAFNARAAILACASLALCVPATAQTNSFDIVCRKVQRALPDGSVLHYNEPMKSVDGVITALPVPQPYLAATAVPLTRTFGPGAGLAPFKGGGTGPNPFSLKMTVEEGATRFELVYGYLKLPAATDAMKAVFYVDGPNYNSVFWGGLYHRNNFAYTSQPEKPGGWHGGLPQPEAALYIKTWITGADAARFKEALEWSKWKPSISVHIDGTLISRVTFDANVIGNAEKIAATDRASFVGRRFVQDSETAPAGCGRLDTEEEE